MDWSQSPRNSFCHIPTWEWQKKLASQRWLSGFRCKWHQLALFIYRGYMRPWKPGICLELQHPWKVWDLYRISFFKCNSIFKSVKYGLILIWLTFETPIGVSIRSDTLVRKYTIDNLRLETTCESRFWSRMGWVRSLCLVNFFIQVMWIYYVMHWVWAAAHKFLMEVGWLIWSGHG